MRVLSAISAAAIVAGAITLSPDASAQRNRGQSATAVVVNYQRVASESALGRDMTTRLQALQAQIQQELTQLQPEGQSIEQERQRLAGSLRNQSEEQLRNNPQVQALAQRASQLQQRAAALEGDLQCTQALALQDFGRQVQPVIQSVAQARGAGIVVGNSATNWFAPEYDVTTTVIQQLDQSARTANVARHAVADCQQRPAGQ